MLTKGYSQESFIITHFVMISQGPRHHGKVVVYDQSLETHSISPSLKFRGTDHNFVYIFMLYRDFVVMNPYYSKFFGLLAGFFPIIPNLAVYKASNPADSIK